MPRLSLYRENKQNDYRYLDRTISEMLTVGGTDLYIHKYMGPTNQGPSIDYTQPEYNSVKPTNIQDLLFLENRDRTYDPNIFRLRGHYNVQNLDFDLSQFGLFLNNDILFITVHYNDMIEILGRKLMVGDVIELPHLLDYNPLNETIPTALKRFYQITDANYASEGFSVTWYPHLWRIKCEKLVDSQEFSQILQEPINKDTYLGFWDPSKTYPQGYVISYGDKNYVAKTNVPAGINPPNPTYWDLDTADNLKDILSTYNKNIEINNAVINEAKRQVPKSGYDTSDLYVIPTYGVWEENGVLSKKINQPAPPVDIIVSNTSLVGTVNMVSNPLYRMRSPVLRVPNIVAQNLQNLTSIHESGALAKFSQINLQIIETASLKTSTGSGPVSGNKLLTIISFGPVTGPFGTADNTYSFADQDPETPGFTGTEPYGPNTMDYRADCDPRFQYISRYTPRSFSYLNGYLTGDGSAPNGLPTGTGISFPLNPQVGDYFLRIDYLPNVLFRWDGTIWVRMSTDVRTDTGFTAQDKSLLSGFINDTNQIYSNAEGQMVPEAQPLSTILTIAPDPLPPID